ncbi:hypothetical protein TSUD_09000 [Trifolium subterraneum]|nr:hypothetical protein TSUD_09000 [Trifolium subterraneum]
MSAIAIVFCGLRNLPEKMMDVWPGRLRDHEIIGIVPLDSAMHARMGQVNKPRLEENGPRS